MATLILPTMPSAVGPLVYAVPVQLIAYHTAVALGTTSISRAISPSRWRWNRAAGWRTADRYCAVSSRRIGLLCP